MDTTYYVYTLLSGKGEPLYVGCTEHLGHRLAYHAVNKPWFTNVEKAQWERFADEPQALRREQGLIGDLEPRHNFQHNPAKTIEHDTGPGSHGLRRHLEDGCMCGACRLRHVHVLSMRNRWVGGETLREIAEDYDLSRERIRQLMEQADPDRGAKRDRRRRLHALWKRNVQRSKRGPCHACGRRLPLSRAEGTVTCSQRCSAWLRSSGVRRLVDEEYHSRHQKAVDRWQVEHLAVEDPRWRVSRARLDGDPPDYKSGSWASRNRTRWVSEGSETWDYCVTAMANDWPCVEWWPEDVRDQISSHLYGTKQEAAA